MKNATLICMCIVCFMAVAQADKLYLKDGQIIEGKMISRKATTVKIRTSTGEVVIEKSKIAKAEFNDENVQWEETDGGTNIPANIRDKQMKREFTEFQNMKRKKNGDRKTRGASIVGLGIGAGLPYGLIGYNAEILFGGRVGLTAGLDISGYDLRSFGAKLYFGDKGDKFRLRLSGLIGDVGTVTLLKNSGNEIIKVPGKSAYFGFQWKMLPWLSMNFDGGFAVPSESMVRYSYTYMDFDSVYQNGHYVDVPITRTAYNYVILNSKPVIALGFVTHF